MLVGCMQRTIPPKLKINFSEFNFTESYISFKELEGIFKKKSLNQFSHLIGKNLDIK